MRQAFDGFYFILKKHLKLSQKNNFLAHFERFLVYAFLHPASYTQIFCQIKCLMEVHNCGKFHYCSICGCQVISFQMFSWQCSIQEMAPFGGGFLGPFPPKYGSSLLKFRPAVASHKAKTVSEHSFKIKCLSGNRTYPKLTNLVHFWAQFTPGKPKILPKVKVFPETTSL